jgi:hypothetical protein
MKPSLAIAALELCVAAGRPVMLHGSPGVGKSDIVRQLTKKLSTESTPYKMIDLRLSQLDPVDLRGVPSVNAKSKTTSWNVPDFFPRDGHGILFLDEINSAAQATQAAAYQLVLDRKLGDYELPEGWAIIAAGNLASDRAIVSQMSTALKNRFTHITFETNMEDWANWALTSEIHPHVLAFIRFRPKLLNEFEKHNDSKEEQKRLAHVRDQQAFATPRSWASLSKIYTKAEEAGIGVHALHELLRGVVGEGAATEFLGYVKVISKVPSIEQLLMDPEKSEVPTDPNVLYAVATGIGARITPDNFQRAATYTDRIPAEFMMLAIKDAITRDPKLGNTPTFTKWATKHGKLLC